MLLLAGNGVFIDAILLIILILSFQAKSLLAQKVSDDFKKEMKHNIESLGRNLNLQPPDAALFVNGMFFDADTLDLVSLMDTLRTELDVLSGLHDIGKF